MNALRSFANFIFIDSNIDWVHSSRYNHGLYSDLQTYQGLKTGLQPCRVARLFYYRRSLTPACNSVNERKQQK